jgi:hypothetical protein
LGKGEFGLSPVVIEKVKQFPVWSGNQPIANLDGPATISAAASAQTGTELASFKATDPGAGTRFTFRIASGNESGAFTIEPRTGRLKLAKAPAAGTYPLTIEVNDSTVPLTLKSTQCEVTIL